MKIECCQHCTERYRACHSTCKTYKKERMALDVFNYRMRREQKENTDYHATRHHVLSAICNK